MGDLIDRQRAINLLKKGIDRTAKGDIGRFYNKIVQNDINAIMELPSAEPDRKAEWILCKDQMPPMDERVLVVGTDGYITIGERYEENEWLVDCGECDATDDEVLAWMPLPSPPEIRG